MTYENKIPYEGPIDISLKDIQLDVQNIRFDHIKEQLTEHQIEQRIHEEEDVRSLIKQIQKDGYLKQPILAVRNQDKYIVKDGNRRICALRYIRQGIITGKISGYQKDHFDIISVYLLTGSEKENDFMIGTIHVSGPKEWKAVNQAGLVYKFFETYGESHVDIADRLGMTKRDVLNKYLAYKATQLYVKRHPEDTNFLHKYSFFAEFYQSKILRSWAEEDPSRLDDFIRWVAEGKLIITYKDVRRLAKLVGSSTNIRTEALAVLDEDNGNIEKAYQILEAVRKTSKQSEWTKLVEINNSLDVMSFVDTVKAVNEPPKMELLSQIKEKIEMIETELKKLSFAKVLPL